MIASLPPALLYAIEDQDEEAFRNAMSLLTAEEQARALETLAVLEQATQPELDTTSEDQAPDEEYLALIEQEFEPMILAIGAVARGDPGPRPMVEEFLADLEEHGWKLREAVAEIWAGERDFSQLRRGLDEGEARLVLRILDQLSP